MTNHPFDFFELLAAVVKIGTFVLIWIAIKRWLDRQDA